MPVIYCWNSAISPSEHLSEDTGITDLVELPYRRTADGFSLNVEAAEILLRSRQPAGYSKYCLFAVDDRTAKLDDARKLGECLGLPPEDVRSFRTSPGEAEIDEMVISLFAELLGKHNGNILVLMDNNVHGTGSPIGGADYLREFRKADLAYLE